MKKISTHRRQYLYFFALFCNLIIAAEIPKKPTTLEDNPKLTEEIHKILQGQGTRYCDSFSKLYLREDLSENCKLRVGRELQAVKVLCGSDGKFKGTQEFKNIEKALFDFTYLQKATTVLNGDLHHCGDGIGQRLATAHRQAAISTLGIFKASVLSKQLEMSREEQNKVSLEWSRYVDATWAFNTRCIVQLNTSIPWEALSQQQILDLEKNEWVLKSLAVVCEAKSSDFTVPFQKYRGFEFKWQKLKVQKDKSKDPSEVQALNEEMMSLENDWVLFGYKDQIDTAVIIIQQMYSQMLKK